MEPHDAIELLAADPAATGLAFDFDGTLSDIVDVPGDATPVEGATAILTSLARTFALVAVISGRSLQDLRSRFAPKGVALLGSYGRERSDRPGPRTPSAGWEAVGVAAAARVRDMPGVVLEHKGAGLALHYRLAPGRGADVHRLASELASGFGLDVRPGRLVAELVAPGPGKGDALEELVRERGLSRVLYAGDDRADLEAFERARTVARPVLVAVRSEEAPEGLVEQADVVVGSPAELVGFLRGLARRPSG